jgi:hypothetical protein
VQRSEKLSVGFEDWYGLTSPSVDTMEGKKTCGEIVVVHLGFREAQSDVLE